MTEEFNNEIVMLKGPDRIRKRPGVIFGHQGDSGVSNYAEMLFEPFVTEVAEGYCKKLEINLYKDRSVEIISYDSGLILSDEINEGKHAWQELFCELYPGEKFPASNYYDKLMAEHNDLFGREGSKLKYGIIDSPQFDLCCVQYASEFMYVESVRDGIKKTLEFSKGYAVSALKKENTAQTSHTRIHGKPDTDVFGKYGSMADVCAGILKSLAITTPDFFGILYDEEKGSCTEFCMKKGAVEDISGPVYQAELTATGKDRYNYPEYTADIKLSIAFDPKKRGINCYHNNRLLKQGGSHLDCALERISAFTQYLFFDILKHREITLDIDYISSHIYLVIETACDYSAVKWQTAARKGIENRMIEEMTYDLFGEDFRCFLKQNMEEIIKVLFNK